MKPLIKLIIFTFCLLIFCQSCVYQRLANKASEFEQAGLYSDAADLYHQSILKNNKYIDSKLGLRRCGQRVLDETLAQFTKSYNEGNDKKAVYYYKQAEEYYNKIRIVGIDLKFPTFHQDFFDESKLNYLSKRYDIGLIKLKDEDFLGAQKVFIEIKNVDPDFREVQKYLKIATFEPKYRNAKNLMADSKFRTAYYVFEDIINQIGSYKDSQELLLLAKDEATIKIGIKKVSSKGNYKTMCELFEKQLFESISSTHSPFIKLVEYNDGDQIPDVMLKGEIVSFSYHPGSLTSKMVKGYLNYNNDNVFECTTSSCKKVKYQKCSMHRYVDLSIVVSLINTKNNQIVLSNNYNESNSDDLNYVTYDGNVDNIIPGNWKYKLIPNKEDILDNKIKDLNALDKLINAKRKIKTKNLLEEELIKYIANDFKLAVEKYNPEI